MGRFVGFPAWETIKATQVKGRLPKPPGLCIGVSSGLLLGSSSAEPPINYQILRVPLQGGAPHERCTGLGAHH
jgi:hypothetical protein